MTERIFKQALRRQNFERPPVWFMRQAGRYHQHYQQLRAKHSFVDLCKNPDLACETTMGPIEDFDFDAAILFSDILFPLEAMGMPLAFEPGPQLGFLLREKADLRRIDGAASRAKDLLFQQEALKLLRKKLPQEKGLIGFVGGPLTLYFFAVEGSHRQGCETALAGLRSGFFETFCERLLPVLQETMRQQAQGGIDAMAIFDTCAGDVPLDLYKTHVVPVLSQLMGRFAREFPDIDLIYYSKGTDAAYWRALVDIPFACLGVDGSQDLLKVLEGFGDRWAIQGNFDQTALRDDTEATLIAKLTPFFKKLQAREELLKAWICGLGHGVLPLTPEQNVHAFLKLQKEVFT